MYIIINPVGGNSDPEKIQEELEKQIGDVTVHVTSADDDVTDLTRRALKDGFRTIVAAGGDGTVHEVLAGMYDHGDAVLGIIPAGTANVIGRALDIPIDPIEAVEILAANQQQKIDVLLCNNKPYLSHISLGLYTDAITDAPNQLKERFGRFAYVAKGVQKLRDGVEYNFALTIDGEGQKASGSQLLIVSMGKSGTGLLDWGLDTKPTDGQMHVIIVQATTPAEVLVAAFDALRGKQEPSTKLDTRVAYKSVTVYKTNDLPISGDGEEIKANNVYVQLLPKALRVIVPAK